MLLLVIQLIRKCMIDKLLNKESCDFMNEYTNFRIVEMSSDFTCTYEITINGQKYVYDNVENSKLYNCIRSKYDINLVQASRNLLEDTSVIDQELIFGFETQMQFEI